MARHVGAATVLAQYSSYAALYRATSQFATGVRGARRKYLAVTASARLAMQTSILSTLIDHDLLPVSVSDPRWLNTSDGRWTWLLRHPGQLVGEAAESANELVNDLSDRMPSGLTKSAMRTTRLMTDSLRFGLREKNTFSVSSLAAWYRPGFAVDVQRSSKRCRRDCRVGPTASSEPRPPR
jgi:hypothetical protein